MGILLNNLNFKHIYMIQKSNIDFNNFKPHYGYTEQTKL